MDPKIIALKEAIDKDTMKLEEGAHQAVLNVAYHEWQKNKEWGMDDMLAWVEKNFGDVARFAVQIGKYNQQVCNGGHMQYYDNGYASIGRMGFGSHDNTELHEWLKWAFVEYGFASTELGAKVEQIVQDFFVEIEEERYTTEDVEDEETGEYHTEEVDNPEFGSIINASHLHALDDRYYKINEEFMAWLETVFLKYLETGDTGLEAKKVFNIAGDTFPPLHEADNVHLCKPKCKLVGKDGNVFNIIGLVREALRKAGQADKAEEFGEKAVKQPSYDAVLALCFDYVEVS